MVAHIYMPSLVVPLFCCCCSISDGFLFLFHGILWFPTVVTVVAIIIAYYYWGGGGDAVTTAAGTGQNLIPPFCCRLEKYCTHSMHLSQINEAFDLLKKTECIRCVMNMQEKWRPARFKEKHCYNRTNRVHSYSPLKERSPKPKFKGGETLSRD